jgi:hypothetical protein
MVSLSRAASFIRPDNHASKRVVERLGAVPYGHSSRCLGPGRRKSPVVPNKSILKAANVSIIGGHHVLALQSRPKDGKQHRCWSVGENTRVAGGRVAQWHVLYPGRDHVPPDILVGRRVIQRGDEDGLLPAKRDAFPPSASHALSRGLGVSPKRELRISPEDGGTPAKCRFGCSPLRMNG